MTERNRTTAEPGISVVVVTPRGEIAISVPRATSVRTTPGLVQPSVAFQPADGSAPRWGDPSALFLGPFEPTPRPTQPGLPGQVAIFLFPSGHSLEFHIPFACGTGGGLGFNGSPNPYFISRDATNKITREGLIWPLAKG